MATDPVKIDVKVKTLSSQTFDFNVKNDMTVREFKEHIAETVTVAADLQRIIYRGRILNDAIQLKEYDMNGKVVHLVERPPPAPPGSDPLDSPQVPTATPDLRHRHRAFGLRSANGQTGAGAGGGPPSLNLSSTLCMNRITVARHMLQCAQNIINHMDNPQVPLDNSPMDILVQETLDTTVVEVGISAISDVDQVQNIMHAFRGAVNAAMRPNSGGPADESVSVDLNSSIASSSSSASSSSLSSQGEVEVPVNEANAVNSSTTPAATAPAAPTTTRTRADSEPIPTTTTTTTTETTATGEAGQAANDGDATTRQQQTTTSPRVLGEVVEEMRNVQRRLEPHLHRYSQILMTEPTYTAEETTRREDDQRVFDRVSEALHYMSHAQHAISDLMLDLASNSPRHLCCRPILIEHSAFVNTGIPPPGDIFVAMGGPDIRMGPAAGFQFTVPLNGDQQPQQQQQPPGNVGTAGAPRPANRNSQQPGAFPPPHHHHHHHVATIPVLVQQTHNGMPTMEQLHQSAAAAAAAALNSNGIQELIQSIVSAAPMATIEVQRGNDPPITINVPMEHQAAAPQSAAATTETQSQAGATTTTTTNNNGSGPATGRTTSATTMPTTSTQTRSTARPQVHVTSIQQPAEMRGPRPFSTNVFNAFDRFLPCNSHHVRENNRSMGGQTGASSAGAAGTGSAGGGPPTASVGGDGVLRMPHGRIQIPIPGFPVGFPIQLRRRPGSMTESNSRSNSRDRQASGTAAGRTPATTDDLDPVHSSADLDEGTAMSARGGLHEFVTRRFFNNADITTDNIREGVAEILISLEELLAPISLYEHPHISIRMSVRELLSTHLQEMLNLLRKDEACDAIERAADERFGSNLIRSIRLLASRLSGILLQSNQRRQDIKQMFRTIFNRHLKDLPPMPWGRILIFALKVCLQTLETKFGTGDTSALTPFLVYKSLSSDEASPMEVEDSEMATATTSSTSMTSQEVTMEAQPSTSGATTNRGFTSRLRIESECEDYPEPLQAEPWHAVVPNGWVATLAKDVEEQKKITDSRAQPLSDAYMEGMTKKRRRTIADARPTGSVADTINSSVREVIENSGFQTTAPVEQIASQISSDVGLQSSYRESMNSLIRNRLGTDPNFDPQKYSNAEKYFK